MQVLPVLFNKLKKIEKIYQDANFALFLNITK